MSDMVLVLNSGSSSIKFGLFEISATEPSLLCKGLLDEHEARPRLVVRSPAGEDLFEATHIHRLLQALLALPTPRYRHHRLLTDTSGRKFSKVRIVRRSK